MKRTRTGRTDSLVAAAEGEQGFWPSYADMMSAVALILFFLMLLSYIQNLITGNDLQNTQEVLEETRQRLVLTTAQVDEAEAKLSIVSADLDSVTADLVSVSADLDEARLTLNSQQE